MASPCLFSRLPHRLPDPAAAGGQATVSDGVGHGPVLQLGTHQDLGPQPRRQGRGHLDVLDLPCRGHLLQRHHGLHSLLLLLVHAEDLALDCVSGCECMKQSTTLQLACSLFLELVLFVRWLVIICSFVS